MSKAVIRQILTATFVVIVIFCTMGSLVGCGEYFEEDTRIVIDYRITSAHEEERVGVKKEYNALADTWVEVPYKYKTFVPDKYELMWEITYMDGHKERKWEECTRFEYNNAKEELGERQMEKSCKAYFRT